MGLECSNCGWSQPEQAPRCPKCGARVEPGRLGGAFPEPSEPASSSGPGAPFAPAGGPGAGSVQAAPKQASRRLVPLMVLLAVAGVVAARWLANEPDGPRPSVTTVQEARVLRISGAAPVARDERCTIRIEPADGRPYNCRVVIRCGSQVLYGALATNGYAHCAVDGGVATRAVEAVPDDSDPDLSYDAATARASVIESNWQVDLEILAASGSPP